MIKPWYIMVTVQPTLWGRHFFVCPPHLRFLEQLGFGPTPANKKDAEISRPIFKFNCGYLNTLFLNFNHYNAVVDSWDFF